MNDVKDLGHGLYEVTSFTNPSKSYVVDLVEKSCSCPSFRFRGPCKHLRALEEMEAKESVYFDFPDEIPTKTTQKEKTDGFWTERNRAYRNLLNAAKNITCR